ncbi:MAG: GNAT family N-acetyltransferase [Nitrospirota bacterium]
MDSIDSIAIIGFSGRLPGAKNVEQFWQNLRNGMESITIYSDKEIEAQGVPPTVFNDPKYVKAEFFLEDVDMFDASFFGFSPKEAAIIDPQHRLFLETAWEALETAGYNSENYAGLVGVFAGAGVNRYMFNVHSHCSPQNDFDEVNKFQRMIGNDKDYLATRVSYKLNLRGPGLTIQTACSTSLVTVHLACQSLLTYQCDIAMAGGVFINLPQRRGYLYQEGMILSPDGHCRTFDANAGGTVPGQGVGIVVLKRLSEALTDGDTIHAVIKGSAINNDGALKVGYTAPSVDGQADVIIAAQSMAQIDPETITYIETHGTGTPLGDPIEIAALTQAFHTRTQKKMFCAIGSVKTNIGHLDAAAGVASLIKTMLALKYKEIPPSLNFVKPNPKIDFDNSPFYVVTELSEWRVNGFPRRAGVSSFGIGGTNAHVVLEEAPIVEASDKSRPWQLLLLSARTTTALDKMTINLIEHFKKYPQLNIADVAYTLQVGRKAFSHRRMIVCKDVNDAMSTLEAADTSQMFTVYQERRDPSVVFMFPGQGSQYVNMGLELYRTEEEFKDQIDRCSEILKPHLGLYLRDILYPAEEDIEKAAHRLKQTYITQPALFTIEYALAKLWMSWGVHPAAMVGHSSGEYVAACLAGVFSLEDALSLVATRSRLMQELPGGCMLAVHFSEKEIQPFLNSKFSLSAINSPSLCVVSGERDAIEDLEEQLSKRNVNCRRLHTSHAFHSKMMEPILDPFTEQVKKVRLNPPKIPFPSNTTGTWITSEQAMDTGYWARHLRQTVRFSDCVGELLKETNRVLLEIGPGHTLSTFARQHPDRTKEHIVLSSIRHPKEQRSDAAFILNTLGQLWLAGIQVDWAGFYKDEHRHRIPLPTYPFERQRHWVEPVEQPRGFLATRSELGKMEDNSNPAIGMELQSDCLSPIDSELKSDYVPPRNKVEQIIVDIWEKLLGIKQIGIHDNFFDLGGDSLFAVNLLAQIEKKFSKKLPPTLLYEAQTVEQLSKILEKEGMIAASNVAVPYTIIPANLLENRQDIIDLWKRNFQGLPEERYRWIYEENPYGPATCYLVKETKKDSVVGATALFPRQVLINGRYYMAGIGGDFAVNKEHRVFAPALLLQNAVISKCNEGKFVFHYGISNRESKSIALSVGQRELNYNTFVKPLQTEYKSGKYLPPAAITKPFSKIINFALKVLSKENRYKRPLHISVEMPYTFDERFDDFWAKVSQQFHIIGERKSEFLNWRYKQSPHKNYEIFTLVNEKREIAGYIVYYIEDKMCHIADILSIDSDELIDSLFAEFSDTVKSFLQILSKGLFSMVFMVPN